jgi:hypothetical protein
MLNGGETFSMGDSGFLRSRWEHYCELMMIYLVRHWFAYAFCSERNVEGMDASEGEISGIRIHFRQRSVVYSSVPTSVV